MYIRLTGRTVLKSEYEENHTMPSDGMRLEAFPATLIKAALLMNIHYGFRNGHCCVVKKSTSSWTVGSPTWPCWPSGPIKQTFKVPKAAHCTTLDLHAQARANMEDIKDTLPPYNLQAGRVLWKGMKHWTGNLSSALVVAILT